MAKKPEPVTLLTTDTARVDLIAVKRGFAFQVVQTGGEEEYPDDTPALTPGEWCKVAIQLLVKCPDARDPLGLSTAEANSETAPTTVTGKTIGSRRKWTAWFSDVGSDFHGDTLLEFTSSRPLDLVELGAVFKAAIRPLESAIVGHD